MVKPCLENTNHLEFKGIHSTPSFYKQGNQDLVNLNDYIQGHPDAKIALMKNEF